MHRIPDQQYYIPNQGTNYGETSNRFSREINPGLRHNQSFQTTPNYNSFDGASDTKQKPLGLKRVFESRQTQNNDNQIPFEESQTNFTNAVYNGYYNPQQNYGPPESSNIYEEVGFSAKTRFQKEPTFLHSEEADHLYEAEFKTLQDIIEMAVPIREKLQLRQQLAAEMHTQIADIKKPTAFNRYLKKLHSLSKVKIWSGGLRKVDIKFGAGILAYFQFIKWLVYLNIFISLFIIIFIIVPTVTSGSKNLKSCGNLMPNSTECCSANYFNANQNTELALDLIQGTGQLEKTIIFIGSYTNEVLSFKFFNTVLYYNIPFAYISTTIAYLLVSIFAILFVVAGGLKRISMEHLVYSNMIFSGCDYSLQQPKYIEKKRIALIKELVSTLEIESVENVRRDKNAREWNKILVIRFATNIFVVLILVVCAAGISLAFDYSQDKLVHANVMTLYYEYLPSLIIVCLNTIIPIIFQTLIKFENYSAANAMRLTLVRTVILRLFSLCVLYWSLYVKISMKPQNGECYNNNALICWETFVGQQMYKLALTDFAIHIIMTFVINYLRAKLALFDNQFLRIIGEQTFDVSKNVLDVVYLQTVCWFGSFFAPILPVMFTVILFCMFYIKKFACLVNSKPTQVHLQQANAIFMYVLLLCYSIAVIPLVISIGDFLPSKSCGPFRGMDVMWVAITKGVETILWLDDMFTYMTIAILPLVFMLLLTIYYYTAEISMNTRTISDLKEQLKQHSMEKKLLTKPIFK